MKELILMAPMQIKDYLNLGNLYDLTLIDFYAKARNAQGYNTFFPLLINVTGSPTEKLMADDPEPASAQMLQERIEIAISNLTADCSQHFIEHDEVIRDDNTMSTIRTLLPQAKNVIESYCPNCNSWYGTDPSIIFCRRCGSSISRKRHHCFAKEISKEKILEKINSIDFFPSYAKKRLLDFATSLPDSYMLSLEKERFYTPNIDGHFIDPKFAAIATLVQAHRFFQPDTATYIHGDVMKKFIYYVIAYLDPEILPSKDVMHDVITGEDKLKTFWRNNKEAEDTFLNSINKRELRAYMLSHSITSSLQICKNTIPEIHKTAKIYVLFNRICDKRNLDTSQAQDPYLANSVKAFYDLATNWKLVEAFTQMQSIVHYCWKKVKIEPLNLQEVNSLQQIQQLYFGP